MRLNCARRCTKEFHIYILMAGAESEHNEHAAADNIADQTRFLGWIEMMALAERRATDLKMLDVLRPGSGHDFGADLHDDFHVDLSETKRSTGSRSSSIPTRTAAADGHWRPSSGPLSRS